MTSCLNCGSLHPLPETDPPLCEPCYGLFEAIRSRCAKLTTSLPFVYAYDPLNALGQPLRDHFRRKMAGKPLPVTPPQ